MADSTYSDTAPVPLGEFLAYCHPMCDDTAVRIMRWFWRLDAECLDVTPHVTRDVTCDSQNEVLIGVSR